MTTQQSLQCHVCGDTADNEALISECLNCSRPFHLNPYNSGDHKDCGDAVIGPSSGIEFWCNPCLTSIEEAERAAGVNDPRAILDHISGADQFLRPPRPETSSTPAAAEDTPAPQSNAPPSNAPPTPSDSPPARRSRPTAPRRYRRIDGA